MTKKLFYAEDHDVLRRANIDAIRFWAGKDLVVDEFSDGSSLVEKVKDYYDRGEKIDLILTDNAMGLVTDMSGLDAIKAIREFDRETPIYMYAAAAAYDLTSPSRNIVKEALQLGATGFIDKNGWKAIEELERITKQYLS